MTTPLTDAPELELSHVSKVIGAARIIDDVDLAVPRGAFVVFVGPSGCGKSTLLRMIAGLEDVSAGSIRIDGKPVDHLPAAERGVAMVFQSYALYPHMTVRQNLSFGLENLRRPRAEIATRVGEAARLLQIENLLDRQPRALSGGQRQRVAIGRAIVRHPRIFLFDEPLSNLDAELRVTMRAEIMRLHERLGNTMVYVTHDQVEAMTMADRIVVLRNGRIEQHGAPLELYNHPVNRFVATFIGSPRMNLLPARIARRGEHGIELNVEQLPPIEAEVACNDIASGTPVSVGIRPEHVVLGAAGPASWQARVTYAEVLGSSSYLHCVLPNGQTIVVHEAGQARVSRGDTLSLRLPKAAIHVFADSQEGAALPRTAVRR
jgi:multiple sugar transport system ATP-binding protein